MKKILKLFSFWKEAKNEKDNYNFENGGYCFQRTKEEYNQLGDTLFSAIQQYEKWICKQYKDKGGLKREYINGQSFVGRYLGDGDSELNTYWCILGRICPKCFREYGQAYYAINCCCDDTIPVRKLI